MNNISESYVVEEGSYNLKEFATFPALVQGSE
jgi:hypothetical protein